MLPQEPEVSIIIVAYNSAAVLQPCLQSVVASLDLPAEIIVIDNASLDNSSQLARETVPAARVIRLENNAGFGIGCNAGAAQANGTYLVFLNPDTIVERNWLAPLLYPLNNQPGVGATTSKILLMDDPGRLNACGNDVHYTGFPACHLLGVEADKVHNTASVTSVSGAAFAIRRELFKQLHGFDPDFFMYAEDNDLSWRLRLGGWQCVYVSDSVVRHHYRTNVTASKFFYLERNRYQLLLKNLKMSTLVALAPALMLAEISTLGFALLRGPEYLRAKARANSEVFSRGRHWRQEHSARAQAYRQPDSVLLIACTTAIDYGAVAKGVLAQVAALFFNPAYRILLSLALFLLPKQM